MKCEWCAKRKATTTVKWQNVWLNVCALCKRSPFGEKG